MQPSGKNSGNFSLLQRPHETNTTNNWDSACIDARKLFAELLQPKFDNQLDGFLEALLCVIQKYTL